MQSALIPILELLAVAAWIVWMLRDEKDKSRPILVVAVIFNLFYGTIASMGLRRESALLVWKYDLILFHLDRALGITGSSIAGHLQGWWKTPLLLIYEGMFPCMICWLFITRRLRTNMQLVIAYAVELVLAPIFYRILPASGPMYAFGPKWLETSSTPLELIRLHSLANAFPSVHTATALVLVLFAPGRKSRIFAMLFLIGTMMATLALGEHYLIDLVPGLAFGCLAWNIGCRQWRRVAGFAMIVLAWSISCRFGYGIFLAEPMLLRAFALCTLGLAAWTLRSAWILRAARTNLAENDRTAEAPAASVPLGAPAQA